MTALDAYRYEQAYNDLAATVEVMVTDLAKRPDDAVCRLVLRYGEGALRRTRYFISEGEQLDLNLSKRVRDKTRALLESL